MTILVTDNKRQLEKIARTIHSSLPKKYQKAGGLHAQEQTPITRQRVLKNLSKTETDIFVMYLDKTKLETRLHTKKSFLYNQITKTLMDHVLATIPPFSHNMLTLVASRRETNAFLNKNFKSHIANTIQNESVFRIGIKIATPTEEKSLQIVDFASWAIHRKYEFEDDTYYNSIKMKIVTEICFTDKNKAPSAR